MDWRQDVAMLAPYGHAWVFARTGDLPRAQELLFEGLRGLKSYRRRLFASGSLRRRLHLLHRRLREVVRDAPETPPGLSAGFRESPRLQKLHRSVELLRPFAERERMALVMIYVDQVPEASIREWLGVDEPFLVELRGRFEGGCAPADRENLRYYRLSEEFLGAVLPGLEREVEGGFSLGRSLYWLFAAACSILILRPHARDGGLAAVEALGWGGLIFVVIAAGFLLFHRRMMTASTRSPIFEESDRPPLVLEFITLVTGPILAAHVALAIAPGLLRIIGLSQGDPYRWYEFMLIVGMEVTALFTAVAYHLPLLARRLRIIG